MVTAADTRAADATAIIKDFLMEDRNVRLRGSFHESAVGIPGQENTRNRVQETISGIMNSVEDKMEDIANGQANGMPIRSLKHFRHYTEAAIQPALNTIAKLHDVIAVAGPLGTIDVPYEEQKALGTQSIDLVKIEEQMVETVNTWMNSTAQLEWTDEDGQTFHGKDVVGLPLPINDTYSRSADGMWGDIGNSITLTVSTGDGFEPRKMITETEAAEKMEISAAEEARRNLSKTVEKQAGSPIPPNQG